MIATTVDRAALETKVKDMYTDVATKDKVFQEAARLLRSGGRLQRPYREMGRQERFDSGAQGLTE